MSLRQIRRREVSIGCARGERARNRPGMPALYRKCPCSRPSTCCATPCIGSRSSSRCSPPVHGKRSDLVRTGSIARTARQGDAEPAGRAIQSPGQSMPGPLRSGKRFRRQTGMSAGPGGDARAGASAGCGSRAGRTPSLRRLHPRFQRPLSGRRLAAGDRSLGLGLASADRRFPQRVWAGNLVFRAVAVKQGENRVCFHYDTALYPWLLAVSWLVLAAGLLNRKAIMTLLRFWAECVRENLPAMDQRIYT